MTDNSYDAWIDGQSASAADLASLAFAGFAHFTAMQIRDGRVKGLDLHLERLRTASLELFGKAVPDALVRERIRSAIPKELADLSLTVTMFSRAGEFTPIGASDDPAILVRTSPAFDGPDGPLRLTLVGHERWLPTIKQVGEAAKTHYLREAFSRGFDDAAFIDRAGRISEATIWNMAFWDGEAVVWPVADVLPGVTMSIIRRQLKALGITQRDNPHQRGSVESGRRRGGDEFLVAGYRNQGDWRNRDPDHTGISCFAASSLSGRAGGRSLTYFGAASRQPLSVHR